MDIKNVTVAGGGVLGSQIAFQSAYCGFNVTVWLRSEGSVGRAKPKFERLRTIYLNTLEAMKTNPQAYCRGLAPSPDMSAEEIDQLKARADAALNSITFTLSYEDAARDCDLVIEAIAENPDEKIAFYTELARRPSSRPTRRPCSPALSHNTLAVRRNTWHSTSLTRSGATTPPRSWGIQKPAKKRSMKWSHSPRRYR